MSPSRRRPHPAPPDRWRGPGLGGPRPECQTTPRGLRGTPPARTCRRTLALGAGLAAWLLLSPAAPGVPIHPGLDEAREASRQPAHWLGNRRPGPLPDGSAPGSWASTLHQAGTGPPADGSAGPWTAGSPDPQAEGQAWSGDLLTLGWTRVPTPQRGGSEGLLSWQGLRDLLLATPLGQEVLQAAVEVLSPAFDTEGNIHVSLFGHGDYVLPGRQLDPPASAPRDPLSRPSASALAPPAEARRAADRQQPGVTMSQLVSALAENFLSFLTHPVTLLFALFGGIGYLALRYAIERRSLRRRRARRARALLRRHGTGGQRRRTPSRSRLHPSP